MLQRSQKYKNIQEKPKKLLTCEGLKLLKFQALKTQFFIEIFGEEGEVKEMISSFDYFISTLVKKSKINYLTLKIFNSLSPMASHPISKGLISL